MVKHKLDILNENCVAYDIIFGCPGWIEGVIQASSFIKSKMAKKMFGYWGRYPISNN